MEKKYKVFLLLSLMSVLLFSASSLDYVVAQDASNTDFVQVEITVKINNISISRKVANLTVQANIFNLPENNSNIELHLGGGGELLLNASNSGKTTNGFSYRGEAETDCWELEGHGEVFPFDSYTMNFTILKINNIECNWTIISDKCDAFFSGKETYVLQDTWKTNNEQIPLSVTSPEIKIYIQRSVESAFMAFLQVIVPIIACYYLVGASLILNPENLSERLRMYVAVFFFAPAYLLTIQDILPYRNSLSFPEVLLTNLLTTTAILCIFGALGKHRISDRSNTGYFDRTALFKRKWDALGVFFAGLFFIGIYSSTIMLKINVPASILISYIVLPSYMIWSLLETQKEFKILEHKKSIIIFLVGIIIISLVFPISYKLFDFQGFLTATLFSAFAIGLISGLILKKKTNKLLALICGVISSIISGLIIGYFFGETFFGVLGIDGAIKGFEFFSIWGYLVGVYETVGLFIGTRYMTRKNKK